MESPGIMCAVGHNLLKSCSLRPNIRREIVPFEDTVPAFQEILDELGQKHPQIRLRDVEYIDVNLFNQLAIGNELLLSAECWSHVHPLLATIPVDWNYTVPYGLIYAKEPPKEVLEFIMAIGSANTK